ncbi:DNA-processing protein DprA [Arcobacter sp. F2176]|uniref:DNA-processing protein DprA n=1 Tax=Arcobacter sp. F2176 TaxID=2044511 RepID=UPI00100B5BAB|nr:DNA-processing protein DprA [Arcobacter sp. F2176]RXJ82282.1 DNA processing protein DprA [Arcobacter sp. F2176]
MISTIDFEIPELRNLKKPIKKLFYKGNIKLLKKPKISIVGTRRALNYTQFATHQLASKLSFAGNCIVSGGAIGVDAISHKAAGTNNTILVSPCGLNHRYPAINKKLIEEIEQQGLILSSFDEDFKSTRYSFVLRNEIVVALGDILIVTQADLNSGSLRSVEYALKMGKEIFVLPHRINESQGTTLLAKNGLAKVIYDIDEFVEQYAKTPLKEEKEDSFLEYCKKNPAYEEAIIKYDSLVYEYELTGKIKIKNGFITLP